MTDEERQKRLAEWVEDYKKDPDKFIGLIIYQIEQQKSLIKALTARIRQLEAQIKEQKPLA